MSSETTHSAVAAGTEKEMFCAPAMMAVFTPTTLPLLSMRGPPELPGLSATSDCTMPSISRPSLARMLRPMAETTPALTVDWKPRGFPIATTSCPTRRPRGLSVAKGRPDWSTRSKARSVATSRPRTVADSERPSVSVTETPMASPTTCALVSKKPSGEIKNPLPAPCGRPSGPGTLIATTASPILSTTPTTACEYASRAAKSDVLVLVLA
eukprot:jgi/Chrpa1/5765/Chrysochromulina_OHIO_Genome00015632-RA